MTTSTEARPRRGFAASRAKEDIVQKIKAGELKSGDPLASTNELARAYGLSYVTMHNVLRELVSQDYLDRINGQGTFVSANWRKSGIGAVGIPIRLQRNPFHVCMIEEISKQAMRLGISPIFGEGISNEVHFISRLVQDGVRAILRFPGLVPESEASVWSCLRDNNMCAVIINDFWCGGGPFSSVKTNETGGVADMVGRLIALGHEKIVFLDEAENEMRTGAYDGYRQAHWKCNMPVDTENVKFIMNYGPSFATDMRRLAEDLLRNSTAAFVTYDVFAVRLIRQLREMGVAVGRDYSIAGFDDIPDAAEYGLSTVRQPIAQLVSRAFEVLGDESGEPVKLEIDPEVIMRSSTGPSA